MVESKHELIVRWIAENPHQSGSDEVWLPAYGLSVWALVGHWQMVDGDIDQVAEDYGIPHEAVEAAPVFYETHREVIQARLDANAAQRFWSSPGTYRPPDSGLSAQAPHPRTRYNELTTGRL